MVIELAACAGALTSAATIVVPAPITAAIRAILVISVTSFEFSWVYFSGVTPPFQVLERS
ncbi:hypothetical protein HerbRD11066_07920 [Herbidospora sp. RD11066]